MSLGRPFSLMASGPYLLRFVQSRLLFFLFFTMVKNTVINKAPTCANPQQFVFLPFFTNVVKLKNFSLLERSSCMKFCSFTKTRSVGCLLSLSRSDVV